MPPTPPGATQEKQPEAQKENESEEPSFEDEVTVVASTRTGRRVEDEPIRVEVVPQEEIDEKVFMTPGDISMMLTETNGLRVQVTSPSLGAASVRVQGLRGRYTQVLADGLPLYGPAGSIGILQIPPMDLGQVEVIKGVASALYGGSALGGVINLISRQPQRNQSEREVLINRTSRGGTDGVVWLSERGSGNWGYTFLGGGHFQERNDIDRDGWTDLPSYRRATARPRVTWEDGSGRSVFFTVGGMAEERRGGSMPDRAAPDGRPFPENLTTRRFDAGIVARLPLGQTRFLTLRSSGLGQWHHHEMGQASERDFHHTWFGEGALTGQSGRHTWVLGAALQRDRYSARERPGFNYNHVVTGVFVQDDFPVTSWLAVSASARGDVHNEHGSFFSPQGVGAAALCDRLDRQTFHRHRLRRTDTLHRRNRSGRAVDAASAGRARARAWTKPVVRSRLETKRARTERDGVSLAHHQRAGTCEATKSSTRPGPFVRRAPN